jgi:hypothetical protein
VGQRKTDNIPAAQEFRNSFAAKEAKPHYQSTSGKKNLLDKEKQELVPP